MTRRLRVPRAARFSRRRRRRPLVAAQRVLAMPAKRGGAQRIAAAAVHEPMSSRVAEGPTQLQILLGLLREGASQLLPAGLGDLPGRAEADLAQIAIVAAERGPRSAASRSQARRAAGAPRRASPERLQVLGRVMAGSGRIDSIGGVRARHTWWIVVGVSDISQVGDQPRPTSRGTEKQPDGGARSRNGDLPRSKVWTRGSQQRRARRPSRCSDVPRGAVSFCSIPRARKWSGALHAFGPLRERPRATVSSAGA